ncbi:delta 1-pyrroline-5-carboxylate reductase [Parelaphostrongylus tenuis]|uniref:Protein SDA1 n=1 Tax=Parelaphostrongylus tenuis TaxID=148309 RepID=A0AAD5R1H3_PARTN|nr:delta 1-pyrroline-5-carboxylate reductase [Parelaphostrongylus tenuis]
MQRRRSRPSSVATLGVRDEEEVVVMASIVAPCTSSRYSMCERNLGLMMEVIRKDPESYKEEFMEQFDHYLHTMKLLQLQPKQHRMELQPLLESVTFLSGLAKYFPEQANEFSSHITSVLRDQGGGLDPHVRLSFCKALVLMRNQNLIDPLVFVENFFELVKIEDKQLRRFLTSSILSLLKRLYSQKKDLKFLGRIRNFCFAKLKDSRAIVARAAQLICIDAFRRRYWRDEKCANVIAETCFHKIQKIQVTAMMFFLGPRKDENGESDGSGIESESEEDEKTIKEVMTAFRHAKKTRKRTKDLERSKKAINKKKKAKKDGRSKECNLFAIQSLYDPQDFADKLFRLLEGSKINKYEVRLLRIALCARVIGVHRLHTLSFYSYLHRYLQPKQRDVTRILLYAAQACHEMVPPDTVEQLVRTIANNFVTDRNSPEAITVGINAIREIFANCPFAATEELLRDLAEYKSYKNKNVSMAARSLITLFRAVNPRLLARKDRGRPNEVDDEKEFLAFAKPSIAEFVSGAEVLDENREDTGEMEVDEGDDSDGSLEISDDDVDEIDSDDESPPTKEEAADVEHEVDESDEDEDDDEESRGVGDEHDKGDEEDKKYVCSEEDHHDDTEMCVDVSGSHAEREKDGEVDPKKKAALISSNRILTQEEFKQIRVYQLKKKLIGEKRLKKQLGSSAKNDDIKLVEELGERMERRGDGDGLPRLKDIEQFHKKKKQTKEERLAGIREGRDENHKFGRPKKSGPHVGRTNRELAKKKVFSMVKAKVRGRNRQRSFRDQQKSLRNYLFRQSGRKPK